MHVEIEGIIATMSARIAFCHAMDGIFLVAFFHGDARKMAAVLRNSDPQRS